MRGWIADQWKRPGTTSSIPRTLASKQLVRECGQHVPVAAPRLLGDAQRVEHRLLRGLHRRAEELAGRAGVVAQEAELRVAVPEPVGHPVRRGEGDRILAA